MKVIDNHQCTLRVVAYADRKNFRTAWHLIGFVADMWIDEQCESFEAARDRAHELSGCAVPVDYSALNMERG